MAGILDLYDDARNQEKMGGLLGLGHAVSTTQENGILARLLDPNNTWVGRALQAAWGGATLPGDVYQGNVSVTGEDGRTNPEVINRASGLATLLTLGSGAAPAAGGAELRAGIRPYQNVPDSLMGFRKSSPQKSFEEAAYPYTQKVRVVYPNDIFDDAVKGANGNHAMERAYRNWPGAIHIIPLPD